MYIAGLGGEGCDVEVKPANTGCKFRTAYMSKGADGVLRVVEAPQHVTSHEKAEMELRDVELRGADQTCFVAITIREPGQEPITYYRGFRVGGRGTATIPAPTSSDVPNFSCYLSSRVATVEGETLRK
jgi:hypothetical protein